MFEKYVQSILDSTLECAYYFVDLETNELAYLNDIGCDLLQIPQDTYAGKTCHQLLYDRNEPCDFCQKDQLIRGSFLGAEMNLGAFNDYPYRQTTLIESEGKKYQFVVALHQPQDMDKMPAFFDVPSFDQAMIRCASVLLNDSDVELALHELLDITCTFYCGIDCSILEVDKERGYLTQKYRYVPEQYEKSKKTPFHQGPIDLFHQWNDVFTNEEDILVMGRIKEVASDSAFFKLMQKEKMQSFLLAPLKKEKEVTAYLLVQNPMTMHMDLRFIQSVVLFVQEGLQKRSMMKQLDNVYDYDLLTGFFNYKKYLRKLKELKDNLPEKLGIVFIDLNSMKDKANSEGLPFGDEQIQHAASVMESFFKQPFYRVDSEQFVCFVPDVGNEDFVQQVDSLRIETVVNEKAEFSVGCSWETGTENMLWQIQEVDQLMRLDKPDFYEKTEDEDELTHVSVQKDLLNAIESKEFEIYFQPKVKLADRTVIGAEALVRRKMLQNDTLLYPAIFVQLYEEQAIIRHLDLYVVDYVCKTISYWMEKGAKLPISVNFSRVTLTEYGIVQTICEICDKYNVPHELLVIEFTERIAMMNEKAYYQIAEEFEREGFLLSLDDFGVAYSNLITLAKINIDEIKIDRSLVENMEFDEKNQIVLHSIIEMCNMMDNMTPLAEGIETEFQADKLLEFGCVYGQGNLFSPPIPTEYFYQKFL